MNVIVKGQIRMEDMIRLKSVGGHDHNIDLQPHPAWYWRVLDHDQVHEVRGRSDDQVHLSGPIRDQLAPELDLISNMTAPLTIDD